MGENRRDNSTWRRRYSERRGVHKRWTGFATQKYRYFCSRTTNYYVI
nr:unnamed protein product [Callosobruchus chinensis]